MKESHQVWLDNHPEYDGSWLQQAIDAGFEVHHVDSDHDNNDIDNLVLIEHNDHMRLHCSGTGLRTEQIKESWEAAKDRIRLGKEAYRLRRDEYLTWHEVGVRVGYEDTGKACGPKGLSVAARYASYHNLPWPLPHKRNCDCTWCVRRANKEKNQQARAVLDGITGPTSDDNQEQVSTARVEVKADYELKNAL